MRTEISSQKIVAYAKLAGVSELIVPQLAGRARLIHYSPGETIMRAGEPTKDFSILAEGTLKVYSISENGKAITVAITLPPALFGDIEYLRGCSCLHNVIAETNSVLICVPMSDVRTYFADNVQFYRMICQNLINKLYESSTNYSRTLLYPVKNRLAYYIFENLQPDGSFCYVNKDLAEHLGITTRHMSRIVTELVEEGILRRDVKERLTVLDRNKLHHFAGAIPQ